VAALSLTLAVGLAVSNPGLAKDEIAAPPTITPSELAERLASDDPPWVLDVRSRREWVTGRIPGSINIPYPMSAEQLEGIPLDREIVLHCQFGARAERTVKHLRALGVKRLVRLEGDFGAWSHQGLPQESRRPGKVEKISDVDPQPSDPQP
jgi:hydroxyacylglutathione hydrolase